MQRAPIRSLAQELKAPHGGTTEPESRRSQMLPLRPNTTRTELNKYIWKSTLTVMLVNTFFSTQTIFSSFPVPFIYPLPLKPCSDLHPRSSERMPLSCMCVCGCWVTSNSCDPMDYSPPSSSVHGVSQARILAISFSRGSSQLRNQTCVFCVGRWIPYCPATRKPLGWVAAP